MPVSADVLRDQLSLQFELVCFVDLHCVCDRHSEIFCLLEQHRKTQYSDNQRLVFYSSHRPDQKFLNHLQRAVSSVDISNFFVVLYTGHDISHELQQANALYGYDATPIGCVVVDLETTAAITSDNFYPSETMCAMPFSAVYVDIDGSVSPCCKISKLTGNINNNTLNEIFNNAETQQIRQQMQKGIKPNVCNTCWHADQLGSTSLRQHSIDKHGKQLDRGWIDELYIRDVTITPSSLCNFKCRICSSHASSQIAVEELYFDTDRSKELKQVLKFARKDLDHAIQESLLEVQHTLDYLHVLGGEPFLLPGLHDLLDKMISSGNAKHLQLEFNTNGSVWPVGIIEQFDHFNKVEILISIDNVGNRFEIERGSTWLHVENTIKQFVALSQHNISIKLCVTVNIQNLLYLDKVVDFANSLGIEIVWIYLESPDYLCIDHVTPAVKDLVFKKYHNHSNIELVQISHRLQSATARSGLEFLAYTNKIDRRRGQDFSKTHPEIYTAMGGQIDR